MKRLVAAGLLLVLGCAPADDRTGARDPDHVEIDAKLPHLPNTKIDVQSYEVRLRFDRFGKTSIPARVGLEVELLADSTDLRLHVDDERMSFTAAVVDGAEAEFEIVDGTDGDDRFGLTGDVLKVTFNEERAAGSVVRVDLAYRIDGAGMDGDRGILFRDAHDDPIFVTRNWPYYARFWLPSNDHPGDIATFDAVIEVPEEGQAAANGYLVEGTYEEGSGVNAEGYRVFRWSQPTPIPTYAINISVGKFEIDQQEYCYDPAVPGSATVACTNETPKIAYVYFLRPNLPEKEAFRRAGRSGVDSAILFSKLLGEYPYEKLGFVTAPHPFSMEAVSLIIMTGPGATVHEVVHHWWGDTVYIKHWGDFWISEGFTTYFTGLYHEIVDGENTSCLIETAPAETRATLEQGVLNNPADTDPMAIFNGVPYCRGASALHALRATIAGLVGVPDDRERSLDLFLRLARRIYQEYRFKLLGSDDLAVFLKRELPALLNGVARSEIDRAIDAWQAEWLPKSK